MRENLAKKKLKAGQPIFGIISPCSDPIIAELVGLAGFDYYMIDGEHGSINPAQAENIVRACESVGITPLARVRANGDGKLMAQFLDAGIMGIMMPGLMNADDVRAFVRNAKYPPEGIRGLGPVRAADYMNGKMPQAEYVAFAQEQILLLPQFEDLEVLERLPEMVQVKGIDGFIFGPRDLAMSMGFTDGPVGHQEVQEVLAKAADIVLGANLFVGSTAGNADGAKALIDKGYLIALNSVQGLIKTSSNAFLKPLRE